MAEGGDDGIIYLPTPISWRGFFILGAGRPKKQNIKEDS